MFPFKMLISSVRHTDDAVFGDTGCLKESGRDGVSV